MSTFDPETGLRSRPEPVRLDGGSTVPRTPRNPYETALAVVWISAASLAVALLLTAAALAGSTASSSGTDGVPALVASVVFAGIAVVVGLLHLAVLAIRWRAPEE